MDDKVEVLNKKMKELDERLFVDYLFIKNDGVALKFIDSEGIKWFLGKYFFSSKIFEKVDIGWGVSPELYYGLAKYFDNFKELCKELFEGDNKIEEQKIIEVTNLDTLQKLLNDSRKLVCKLQSKIDKINNWKPEYKEKEEDKIDILNEYMKSLDGRFSVEEKEIGICLYYKDEESDKFSWSLATYNFIKKEFKLAKKLDAMKKYEEMVYYYKNFVDKVKELYRV